MSSDDDKTSEKGSQILFEYYRKYSQNRNLSKYFSGTSVSYLPPVVSDEDKSQESPTQSQHKDLIKITIDESEIVIENPSSDDDNSFSDHRKLEWDNGADIGYNSARKNADKLQKSFSLPALDLLATEIKTAVAIPSTVITHSNSEENIEIAVFSSSSSHTSSQPQKNSNSSSLLSKNSPLEAQIPSCSSEVVTGKSSSSKSIELKSRSSSNSDDAVQLRDFQKTINYLKQKIGLPGAHSTPNVDSQQWGQYKMVGNGAVKKVPKAVGRRNKNDNSSETSKSAPKQHKSKVKTKVVELSISTPINVNCRSFSCETPVLKTDAQPKAVQTDSVNLRHTETQFDLGLPQSDNHREAICDDMADSASSFEYISVGRTSGKGGVKLMNESSRTSRTSFEDVDQHLERLQQLLRSKKLNSSTKRRYIRKLLNELKDLDNSSDSSDFFIPKKDSQKCQSSKSVKDDPCSCGATLTTSSNMTVPNKVITGTESEPVKFTAQVQELQDRLVASLPTSKHQHFELPKSIPESGDSVTSKTEDYLLKFAENERAYQLSWINNEISHLSKLKTILELNKKNGSKKTSNYNVIEKGGQTRKYVINTDVNLESKTKINYRIDGKEYAISDSNSSSSDRVVIADIKVSSDDNHTNINIKTICSMCKQVICVCKSGSGSHTSSHREEESLQSLLQLESLTPEDFNSLQRIFKGCDCTTKNPSCSCGFVRKLLNKFQVQLKKMEGVSIQTDPLEFVTGFDQKLCQRRLDIDVDSTVERRQVQTDNLPDSLDAQVQADKQLQPQSIQTSDPRLERYIQTDKKPKNSLESETQVVEPLQALGTQTFHLFEVNSKNQQTSNQSLAQKVQTDNLQNLESQVQVDQLFDLKSQQTSNQGVERQIQTEELRCSLQPQTKVSELNAVVQTDKNQVDRHTDTVVTKDEGHSQTTTKSVCQCVQTEDDCLDVGTNPQPQKRAEKIIQASLETRSVQTSPADKDGTQTTTSSNSAASRVTCFCCKQKAFLAEVSYLQEGNDSMVVCTRCYYNRPRYCLHNACRCWSYWRSNNTERNGLCQCCRKRPPGLMYTVTLPDNQTNAKPNGDRKIQVQDGWSGKSLKDKENHSRKMIKEKVKKKVENVVQGTQYTLTDYLIKNKPEFIFSAEHRRQMLLNSRILREQQTDNVKLNFLENNENPQSNGDKYKLFTGREMKEINRRNYKKLPEVQQKLVKQRQNRLRRADKLISSIFARKVQKSILKGKGSFPIDKPLTHL